MKFQRKLIVLVAFALLLSGVKIGHADDKCHGTFRVALIGLQDRRLSSTLTVEYKPEKRLPSLADGMVTFPDKTTVTLPLKGVADPDPRGDESIELNSPNHGGGGDRGPGLYSAHVSMFVKNSVNPGPPQFMAKGNLQLRVLNMNYEGVIEGPISCPERIRREPFGPIDGQD